MSNYGKTETWKIIYVPKIMNGGIRGVALVEADTRQMAMHTFQKEYAGQYHTVSSCKKLLD